MDLDKEAEAAQRMSAPLTTDLQPGQKSPPSKRKFEDDEHNDLVLHKRPRNGSTYTPPLFDLPSEVQLASRPYVGQNLISLYGLDETAQGVARRNEETGAKINKLRKSYGNKIKDLPGNNEAIKRSNDLMGILETPEDVFHNAVVAGRDLRHGLPEALFAKLDKAVQLAPGKMPRDDDLAWKKYLAIDENNRQIATTAQPSPVNMQRQPRDHKVDPLAANHARSMRRGAKRRYDDDSFEGYGEGFGDDSDAPLAAGLDDDELANRKRSRPRKDGPISASISQLASNTVSVGSGSYSSR